MALRARGLAPSAQQYLTGWQLKLEITVVCVGNNHRLFVLKSLFSTTSINLKFEEKKKTFSVDPTRTPSPEMRKCVLNVEDVPSPGLRPTIFLVKYIFDVHRVHSTLLEMTNNVNFSMFTVK